MTLRILGPVAVVALRDEEDRVPVIRSLDAFTAVADPLGLRRTVAVHRARGRGRRARGRRRVLSCAPFRAPAVLSFPLLAAIGARTSRIEIGTGVIDMRYENPLYMAEDAGAADLISDGRLQLGISRGSPER